MMKQDKNTKQEFLRRFKYIGEIMWLYMKEASVEHYEVEIGDIQEVLDEGYDEVLVLYSITNFAEEKLNLTEKALM